MKPAVKQEQRKVRIHGPFPSDSDQWVDAHTRELDSATATEGAIAIAIKAVKHNSVVTIAGGRGSGKSWTLRSIGAKLAKEGGDSINIARGTYCEFNIIEDIKSAQAALTRDRANANEEEPTVWLVDDVDKLSAKGRAALLELAKRVHTLTIIATTGRSKIKEFAQPVGVDLRPPTSTARHAIFSTWAGREPTKEEAALLDTSEGVTPRTLTLWALREEHESLDETLIATSAMLSEQITREAQDVTGETRRALITLWRRATWTTGEALAKDCKGSLGGTRAKLARLAREQRIERRSPQGKRTMVEYRASDPAQCVWARQRDTADSAASWRAILGERS